RDEPRVRTALRRLALHPAPDALSGNADDEGAARARPDPARAARGVRPDDSGRAERAALGRGDRVPALARRALDEAEAVSAGDPREHALLPQARQGHDQPHLPRQLALARRPRERAAGVRTLPLAA